MSAILSQEEIAALMQIVQAKEKLPPQLSVEPRDFSRPLVLSNDELDSWKGTLSKSAKALGQAMAEMLKLTLQCDLTSLEQSRYENVLNATNEPCCVYRFKMDPHPMPGFLSIDPVTSLAVVDRLLGGSGKAKFEARELRTAEKPIVDRFGSKTIAALAQSLAAVVKFNPTLGAMSPRKAEANFLGNDEAVLFATFGISGDIAAGEIRFAIPFANLPTSRTPSAKKVVEEAKRLAVHPTLLTAINPARINASATLGTAEIRLSDLLMLEPGDVITLRTLISDKSKVSIANVPSFEGQLGEKNGKWAVEISNPISGGRIGGKR